MEKPKKIKTYINNTIIKYTSFFMLIFYVLYIGSLSFIFNLSIMMPNNKNSEIIANQMTWGLEELRSGLEALSENPTVLDALEHKGEIAKASGALYELKNTTLFTTHFILMDGEGEVLSSDLYDGDRARISSSYALKMFKEKLHHTQAVEDTDNLLFHDQQKSIYYMARRIDHQGVTKGYVFYFIKDFPLKYTHNQKVYVTDSFDNILSSTDDLWRSSLGKLTISKDSSFHQAEGNHFYVATEGLKENGLYVTTVVPINLYRELLLHGAIFMAISGIIVAMSTMIITPKILNNTLKPLDALVNFMRTEHESQTESLKDHKIEELQMIYEEYSNKISEIKHLIETNREIVEKKKSFEIKHLESKFNPHFLYNVLEMVKYEILFDPDNASDIIVRIANLMRYKVNTEEAVVPLKTDINYLRDYVAIQKMRYGHRLVLKEDYEPEVLALLVPKLIIQPLVENAIKHNIDIVEKLNITLRIQVIYEVIHIEVSDNGKGLSPEALEEIKNRLQDKGELSKHNGLRNTHSIIQLLYGPSYGLDITSKVGMGTKVWITIPVKEERLDD